MPLTRRFAIACGAASLAAAPEPPTAWRFEMPSIEEGTLRFQDFRGKVLLVVNTASYCGYTPQYKQLEALHRDLGPKGLAVIGIPSQDFGQESGTNAEVKAFCELTYGVEFPMAGLSHVRGPEAVPFYRWVRDETRWEPRWNFFKVLIGRDGQILGTFSASDEPDSGRLRVAIDRALGQSQS